MCVLSGVRGVSRHDGSGSTFAWQITLLEIQNMLGGSFFIKVLSSVSSGICKSLPCFKPCWFGKFVAWSLVYGSCVAKECRDTEGYSVKEVLWEPALTMGQSIAYAVHCFFSVSIVKRNRRNFWSHWCENLYWVQTVNILLKRFIWILWLKFLCSIDVMSKMTFYHRYMSKILVN